MAVGERRSTEALVDTFHGIVGYGITEEWERGYLIRELIKALPVDDCLESVAALLEISVDDVVRYVARSNSVAPSPQEGDTPGNTPLIRNGPQLVWRVYDEL